MNPRFRAACTVAPLVLALALGACGKSNPGVATAGGKAASASANAAAANQADLRRFTACMREQGVNMPDPDTKSDGGVMFNVDPNNGGTDPAKVDAAMQKCRNYLPNGGEPPALDPQQVDKMRQYAKCMRANGVPNFPDPDDKGMIKSEPGKDGFDPNDPAFKTADEACRKYAPADPAGPTGGKR